MSRAVVRCLVQYGLGLGVLVWAIWYAYHWHIVAPDGERVGLSALLRQPVHVSRVLASGGLFLAAVSLTFLRWFVLVRAQELPLTLRSAFRFGIIGYYFSQFMPGSVGGDVIKAVCVAREQRRRTVAVATVVLDRVIGIIGLSCLVLIVGALSWGLGWQSSLQAGPSAVVVVRTVYGTAALAVAAVAALWLALRLLPVAWGEWCGRTLARIPRVGAPLGEVWSAAWMYRGKGGALAVALASAVISHAVQVLSFYFAATALLPPADGPTLAGQFILFPAGATIQSAVPTPGGLGGGEAAFGALYASCGFPFAAGVLSALCYRLVQWFWGLVGGLVYWRLRAASPAPAADASFRGAQAPRNDASCPTITPG